MTGTEFLRAPGVQTAYGYESSLGRMTSRWAAFGTADANQATVSYDDINRTVTTGQDLRMNGGTLLRKETVKIHDGLGRLYEEHQKTDGSDIVVRTEYDALGRVLRRSVPAATPTHWETFAYDALGRVTTRSWSDGASEQTQYQVAEISGLAADQTKLTDAAGKWRVLANDALGRLVRVREPAGSGGAAAETSYAYDSRNNLLSADEGGRMRSFVYDWLGRLTQASNPESGTVNYVYDSNGNLTQRTDARGIVTTIAYDFLNRPLSKVYSGGTSGAGYSYDKLRLTAVSTGGVVSRAFTYTPGGRIATSTQTTGGVSYPFTYAYYMDGSVASVQYPSGRTVSYPDTDRVGRPWYRRFERHEKKDENCSGGGSSWHSVVPDNLHCRTSVGSLGSRRER